MKRILALSRSDFQSTFRDPVFKVLLFLPLIVFVIIRFVLPPARQQFPVLEPYQTVILMWGCLQSATLFGFIYGFLFLEEKEEHLWPVLRVTPVPVYKIVLSRILTGFIISTAVNYCLFHFGNIVQLSFIKEIILSVLFSLAAPLIALYLGAMAKNRIEGLAQMKIINILLIIPALIYFLPWKAFHLTAVIPSYWPNRALEQAAVHNNNFWLFAGAGFIFYGIALRFLNRKLSNSLAN